MALAWVPSAESSFFLGPRYFRKFHLLCNSHLQVERWSFSSNSGKSPYVFFFKWYVKKKKKRRSYDLVIPLKNFSKASLSCSAKPVWWLFTDWHIMARAKSQLVLFFRHPLEKLRHIRNPKLPCHGSMSCHVRELSRYGSYHGAMNPVFPKRMGGVFVNL